MKEGGQVTLTQVRDTKGLLEQDAVETTNDLINAKPQEGSTETKGEAALKVGWLRGF